MGTDLSEELLLQLQAPFLVGGCVCCQMANVCTLQHHLHRRSHADSSVHHIACNEVYHVQIITHVATLHEPMYQGGDASLWLTSRLTCHVEVWYDRGLQWTADGKCAYNSASTGHGAAGTSLLTHAQCQQLHLAHAQCHD